MEEKYEPPTEEIDINDYIPHPSEQQHSININLLNIYTYYYKQINNKDNKITMFDGINYEEHDSTNKCMETLYEEMYKYSSSEQKDKDVLYMPEEVNLLNLNISEAYMLYINNESKYVCRFLLPLLFYLASENWIEMKWFIVPFKNT